MKLSECRIGTIVSDTYHSRLESGNNNYKRIGHITGLTTIRYSEMIIVIPIVKGADGKEYGFDHNHLMLYNDIPKW